MTIRKRVGVLISGRGSNLQSLIDACAAPDYPAEIALVISNRPGAFGLERARSAGIPAAVIDHKAYPNRAAFDADLDRALREAGIEIVASAGFMRLLTEGFCEAWRDRQLNIHPSLLPAFRGLHPQRQALDAGVSISGATVHFVRAEMDAGPILAQAAVPVLSGDTEDTLAARILAAEHRLYPHALALVASGAAWVEGETVRYAAPDTLRALF
ncbi:MULTISPECIES: phosphoribosylglycinamide formyltransferase [Rhodomicrobium]|uniref:phosphoribosylglycinamide formyltransferase n=1 Tax=Rhodomicrobium TaxID=1068 RepID=UPI000B4A9C36|nr:MULTISPECIES: phosphoribosylglycinamide formyltransferase [Rhodomicrobium]